MKWKRTNCYFSVGPEPATLRLRQLCAIHYRYHFSIFGLSYDDGDRNLVGSCDDSLVIFKLFHSTESWVNKRRNSRSTQLQIIQDMFKLKFLENRGVSDACSNICCNNSFQVTEAVFGGGGWRENLGPYWRTRTSFPLKEMVVRFKRRLLSFIWLGSTLRILWLVACVTKLFQHFGLISI